MVKRRKRSIGRLYKKGASTAALKTKGGAGDIAGQGEVAAGNVAGNIADDVDMAG